jgi:hypothetical protein
VLSATQCQVYKPTVYLLTFLIIKHNHLLISSHLIFQTSNQFTSSFYLLIKLLLLLQQPILLKFLNLQSFNMQFAKTLTTVAILLATVSASVPSTVMTERAANTTTDLDFEEIASLSAKYAEMAANVAAGLTNTTSIDERSLDKRTCGSLSGTLLTICQQACIATCVS